MKRKQNSSQPRRIHLFHAAGQTLGWRPDEIRFFVECMQLCARSRPAFRRWNARLDHDGLRLLANILEGKHKEELAQALIQRWLCQVSAAAGLDWAQFGRANGVPVCEMGVN